MRASHIHKFHRAGCLFLECLWNEVFHLVSCIPQNEMVVFAGDMNGHVGSSNVGYDGTHGGFGCGSRNADGLQMG